MISQEVFLRLATKLSEKLSRIVASSEDEQLASFVTDHLLEYANSFLSALYTLTQYKLTQLAKLDDTVPIYSIICWTPDRRIKELPTALTTFVQLKSGSQITDGYYTIALDQEHMLASIAIAEHTGTTETTTTDTDPGSMVILKVLHVRATECGTILYNGEFYGYKIDRNSAPNFTYGFDIYYELPVIQPKGFETLSLLDLVRIAFF